MENNYKLITFVNINSLNELFNKDKELYNKFNIEKTLDLDSYKEMYANEIYDKFWKLQFEAIITLEDNLIDILLQDNKDVKEQELIDKYFIPNCTELIENGMDTLFMPYELRKIKKEATKQILEKQINLLTPLLCGIKFYVNNDGERCWTIIEEDDPKLQEQIKNSPEYKNYEEIKEYGKKLDEYLHEYMSEEEYEEANKSLKEMLLNEDDEDYLKDFLPNIDMTDFDELNNELNEDDENNEDENLFPMV